MKDEILMAIFFEKLIYEGEFHTIPFNVLIDADIISTENLIPIYLCLYSEEIDTTHAEIHNELVKV